MPYLASISGVVTVQKGEPSGITVKLAGRAGDIVATTETDRNGQYRFEKLSGPTAPPEAAPGAGAAAVYRLVLVVPPGLSQISTDPGPILIDRVNTNVRGVNFTLVPRRMSRPVNGSRF